MKGLFLILPIVSSVLSLSTLALSQSGTSEKNSTKYRISIAIAAKQDTFKVGDSIVLHILVKNISEYKYCEKSISETDHAEWNGYRVEVKDADGNPPPRVSKPLLPLRQRPELSGSRGLLCILPGEVFNETILVDQIVNMSTPEAYHIQIIHRDTGTDTDITSNTIQVKITP